MIEARSPLSWHQRAKNVPSLDSRLNTLDQVLSFTHTYAAEIRQDAKARRIYQSFLALTNNQFEALLAFSLWKVRNLPLILFSDFAASQWENRDDRLCPCPKRCLFSPAKIKSSLVAPVRFSFSLPIA